MGSLRLQQDFFVTNLKNNMPSTLVATAGGEVARILLAASIDWANPAAGLPQSAERLIAEREVAGSILGAGPILSVLK